MAVLVTRPQPDNEATAVALQARGFEVLLAPMLRFEPVVFAGDLNGRYGGVIVTSANALRAIEPQLDGSRLLELPLFAVGDHTAEAARGLGFAKVFSAEGDAAALRDLIRAQASKKKELLYLAGEDVARDLAGQLSEYGLRIVKQTTYRMVPLTALPNEVCDAFAASRIAAVLHYSGRSARAFLNAARADGVEISALAVAQCCISGNVAAILREAGATRVLAAESPDEKALFTSLERALRAGLA
jgi:uroporphyrinogen-III synthase